MLRTIYRVLGTCTLLFSPVAYAQENTAGASMEAGIGFASQVLADYRGSDEYGVKGLPLPYFLYRGKIIKVDKQGVRGEFISSDRFELNISADASLSASGDDNRLRQGMPELDSTFELGPSFNFNLSGQDFAHGWSFRVPVRAVFATDFTGIDYVGYLLNARLTWRKPQIWGLWRASFNTGLIWADNDYHSYYYSVDTPYVTSERPYFKAGSGYSGASSKITFYRSHNGWRWGVSLRYDNLSGADFEDSPLVATEHYGSISFGVTRRLWSKGSWADEDD